VVTNIPAAPRLAAAEARGASGLAAISEPSRISVTPMNRASWCLLIFARSGAKSGLEETNGSMFSTS